MYRYTVNNYDIYKQSSFICVLSNLKKNNNRNANELAKYDQDIYKVL